MDTTCSFGGHLQQRYTFAVVGDTFSAMVQGADIWQLALAPGMTGDAFRGTCWLLRSNLESIRHLLTCDNGDDMVRNAFISTRAFCAIDDMQRDQGISKAFTVCVTDVATKVCCAHCL